MSLEREFYFLRHGHTLHHEDDRHIELTEKGIKQAKDVSKLVSSLPLRSICHSPLRRVIQTKNLAVQNEDIPHIQVEELEECTVRIWYDLVETKGVSSLKDTQEFIQRVRVGLEKSIMHPSPCLLVAHGGVYYALCSVFGIGEAFRFLPFCGLVHFSKVNGLWKADVLNAAESEEAKPKIL